VGTTIVGIHNPTVSKTKMTWLGRGNVLASIAILSSSWHLLLPTALAFNNFYDVLHRDVRGMRYLQRATRSESLLRREYHYRNTHHRHFDQLQLHQMGESSSTTTTASATTELTASAPTTVTFTSPTYHIYIEDTDAYGVMYNGNYLRSYERALSHVSRQNHDSYSWMVTSVTNQKFRSSPSLGEEYIIRGVMLEEDEERGGECGEEGGRRRDHEEVWQLEMATRSTKNTSNNGDTGGDDDDDNNWIVHNSATVTIINTLHDSSSLPNEKMAEKAVSASTPQQQLDEDRGGTIFEQRCTAYSDEFDTHHFYFQNQHRQQSSFAPARSILPIRNAMNFFERSRTNYLGGPDILRKMQVDEDILWVVTSVDDGELMLLLNEEDSDFVEDEETRKEEKVVNTYLSNSTPSMNASRREITVRTNFIVKRRGMIVECRHELFMDDDDDDNVRPDSSKSLSNHSNGGKRSLLAKATVTIMALKGSTRRPTSKLPNWILNQIMGTPTAN
jgi:hypothetical protein